MQTGVEVRREPFPHSVSASLLDSTLAEETLAWLETDAPWVLRVEDFYEQHECGLTKETLPSPLRRLVAPEDLQSYANRMLAPIALGKTTLVEATAHKLSGGQSIKIHNDYIGGEETHRILVQLNRGWSDEQGGFLMLFASSCADDLARIVRPVHGSAIAFEISENSFHAVSATVGGERYTLVFSFRRDD